MSTPDDPKAIPTLRDPICPGDELAPRGLWLPIRGRGGAPESRRPTLAEWQSRLPKSLRERGPQMLDTVLERVRRRCRQG